MSIFSRKNADGSYKDKADKLRDMLDADAAFVQHMAAKTAEELTDMGINPDILGKAVREPEAILEADLQVIKDRQTVLADKMTGLRSAIMILSEELRQAEASSEAYAQAMATIRSAMNKDDPTPKFTPVKADSGVVINNVINDPNEVLTKSVK